MDQKLGRVASFDVERNIGEVEHVKAHRTKKDKKYMSQFEKFVAEGHDKADELAKAEAMLDEGFMAETKAEKRKMQHCSMHRVFTVW